MAEQERGLVVNKGYGFTIYDFEDGPITLRDREHGNYLQQDAYTTADKAAELTVLIAAVKEDPSLVPFDISELQDILHLYVNGIRFMPEEIRTRAMASYTGKVFELMGFSSGKRLNINLDEFRKAIDFV